MFYPANYYKTFDTEKTQNPFAEMHNRFARLYNDLKSCYKEYNRLENNFWEAILTGKHLDDNFNIIDDNQISEKPSIIPSIESKNTKEEWVTISSGGMPIGRMRVK